MAPLPPGQVPRPDFPRFGLPRYAQRRPRDPRCRDLIVTLPDGARAELRNAIEGLPRTHLVADFHCVTTWSRLGLRWSGVRFADLFALRIAPLLADAGAVAGVVLVGQDGYRTSLPIADALAPEVLLADRLDDEPLSIAHGAPLRLVAPAHYGYKNLKHLAKLALVNAPPDIKRGPFAFLDHPRARVDQEERGRWFPGWLLRRLYRPLIAGTVRRFQPAPADLAPVRGHGNADR
jgi:DMSO/TMAO reductase YedYZ molybdopterin-dependent catalytic subunit